MQELSLAVALQAGRDLRIIVDAKKIQDADAILLSQDIAKNIEAQLTYPTEKSYDAFGQILVDVDDYKRIPGLTQEIQQDQIGRAHV